MKREVKTLLSPQRISILGRKRYSVDANACDVIKSSFDDCWRAIERLWIVTVGLVLVLLHTSAGKELLKKFHDGVKTVFQHESKS